MQKHDNVEKTVYGHHIVPMENPWDKKEHIDINHVFEKIEDSEEEIYPVTINEIASEQKDDNNLKAYFNKEKVEVTSRNKYFSLKVIDETNVVAYKDTRLVIPKTLQSKVVQWYHHYLFHPGQTRLEETIATIMYWRSLRSNV